MELSVSSLPQKMPILTLKCKVSQLYKLVSPVTPSHPDTQRRHFCIIWNYRFLLAVISLFVLGILKRAEHSSFSSSSRAPSPPTYSYIWLTSQRWIQTIPIQSKPFQSSVHLSVKILRCIFWNNSSYYDTYSTEREGEGKKQNRMRRLKNYVLKVRTSLFHLFKGYFFSNPSPLSKIPGNTWNDCLKIELLFLYFLFLSAQCKKHFLKKCLIIAIHKFFQ